MRYNIYTNTYYTVFACQAQQNKNPCLAWTLSAHESTQQLVRTESHDLVVALYLPRTCTRIASTHQRPLPNLSTRSFSLLEVEGAED